MKSKSNYSNSNYLKYLTKQTNLYIIVGPDENFKFFEPHIYGWTWASQLKVNLLFHIRKMDLELLSLSWLIVGCIHVALMLTPSSQPSLEIIARTAN